MSAFTEKARAMREAALQSMREKFAGRKAPRRRGGKRNVALPPCPTVEEQREMIRWVHECPWEEFIEKLRDEEFRHTFNGVFNYWVIRNQIRTLRLHRGWTQPELAERAGLTWQTISRLENIFLPTDIRIGTLLRLAHAFDVAFICRFQSWGTLLEDVANISRFSENVRSFDEDPAFFDNEGTK